MQLFHLYNHHKFYKLIPSDFWVFEFSIWLHVLARSLITIFIPILMLTSGYKVGEVMIFYFIYSIIDVPLNFIARWVTEKIGARFTIIIGNVFIISFFLLFSQLSSGNWGLLIVLAILAALYDTFYWVSHLFLFIKSNKGIEDTGKNMGILYIVKRLATLLGPAIGALILIFSNQQILIASSIVLFAISIVPLLKVDDFKDRPETKRLTFKEFFKPLREKKNYLSLSLYSIHATAENVLWPLFIFVLFGTIESVAAVPIIVSITAMIFSYFTSKIKEHDREKMIVIGSSLIAITWILRITTDITLLYYLSIFFVGLFSLLVIMPLDVDLFSRGKERDALSSSMYRNIFSMFPRVILYGILALVLNLFHVSFILAIISLFILMLINYAFLVLNKRTLLAQNTDR